MMVKMVQIISITILLISTIVFGYGQEYSLRTEADNKKFQQGMFFLSINEYRKALNELYEYLDIYVNGLHRAKAYRAIASIYLQNSEFEKAIRVYARCASEFPLDEDGMFCLYQIGMCYYKMGYEQKATAIFNQLIKEYPDTQYAKDASMMIELIKIGNDN